MTITLDRAAAIRKVARAAVSDHAKRDPLGIGLDLDNICSRAQNVRYRLSEMRWCREFNAEQGRRSLSEVVSDAQVLGLSRDLAPKYSRHTEELVIRVRYADTWLADYGVTPNPDDPASCWQD